MIQLTESSKLSRIVTGQLFLLICFIAFLQVAECLAISNPSAIYCEKTMGYQYLIEYNASGAAIGTCVFPNKSSVNAWNFYKGKEGKDFSYCVKKNYLMETDQINKEGYEVEIPVCVSSTKQGNEERIPMIDFMKMEGDVQLIQKSNLRIQPSSLIKEIEFDKKTVRTTFPAFLDWRNYNGHAYIGPVRNQGTCGACYAFGAAAAAEGAYNIIQKKYDSQCVDFSEAFIAWCLGKYGAYSNHFSGCDGADYDYAELTALTSEGITYETNFSYTGADPGSCTHMNDPVITFKNWGRLESNNDIDIKWAISTHGVIDVAVYVTNDFQNYQGGIFTDLQRSCPDGAYTATNHAVALVGWGTDSTTGLYWILRNSWGVSWGENGYMRIQAHSARVACAATYLAAHSGTSSTSIVPIYNLLLGK